MSWLKQNGLNMSHHSPRPFAFSMPWRNRCARRLDASLSQLRCGRTRVWGQSDLPEGRDGKRKKATKSWLTFLSKLLHSTVGNLRGKISTETERERISVLVFEKRFGILKDHNQIWNKTRIHIFLPPSFIASLIVSTLFYRQQTLNLVVSFSLVREDIHT